MGFSLSPQGSPGVKGSRGHRGEEGEPVSFCDSLPSTFFPFPLKKLYFPQGIVGFCLYAFCSLRGGVGCFFPLLFVCITRDLLNLLVGERREQSHLRCAWHVFGGRQGTGHCPSAPA